MLALLAISLISGAASEGFDRLWEAHFLITFFLSESSGLPPATWFGILGIAGSVLGILAAHFSEKHLDIQNPRLVTVILLSSAGLRTGCILAFALAPSLTWAVVSFQSAGTCPHRLRFLAPSLTWAVVSFQSAGTCPHRLRFLAPSLTWAVVSFLGLSMLGAVYGPLHDS